MDFERKHGLAFLLSLSAIPMTGCPDNSESTSSNATTESSGGDPTTDPTSVTNTTTTSMTSADTTDASMSMGMTTDPSMTDPTTTETVTDTTTTDATTTDATTTDATTTDATTTDATTTDATTTDATTGGSTGDPSEVCIDLGAHVVKCAPAYAMYEDEIVAYCDEQLMYGAAYSAECGTATEEFYACLGTADCDEVLAETACPDEQMAAATACGM